MTSTAPPPVAAGGNWLMTSAAAKADLARRMRDALRPLRLRLLAADVSPLSAAFHYADASALLPPLGHPDHLPRLIDLCSRENVRVLLPTRDADLLF